MQLAARQPQRKGPEAGGCAASGREGCPPPPPPTCEQQAPPLGVGSQDGAERLHDLLALGMLGRSEGVMPADRRAQERWGRSPRQGGIPRASSASTHDTEPIPRRRSTPMCSGRGQGGARLQVEPAGFVAGQEASVDHGPGAVPVGAAQRGVGGPPHLHVVELGRAGGEAQCVHVCVCVSRRWWEVGTRRRARRGQPAIRASHAACHTSLACSLPYKPSKGQRRLTTLVREQVPRKHTTMTASAGLHPTRHLASCCGPNSVVWWHRPYRPRAVASVTSSGRAPPGGGCPSSPGGGAAGGRAC